MAPQTPVMILEEISMRFLALGLAALLACGSAQAQEPAAAISVDLGKSLGAYKPIYSWFGYDEANFTTGRDGKKLLRELRDLSPVPVFIRAHHLLTTGDGTPELKWSSTNVYREDASGKPIYDFTILDGIFDEYKAAGVVPMVELGFMPKDLTSGTNEYQVHYPGRTNAYKFLDEFLGHVTAAKVPLDFISFHAKGRPQIQGGEVVMGLAKELNDVDKGFEIIARHKMNKLPIILSEADPEGCAACSMKVNPANAYRNGTLYPSYTAAAYKGLLDLEARRNTNLISMLSWSFEFENKDYFEGFRSLSTNGIDKPVLNFFRMAALMKGMRVAAVSDGAVPLDRMMAGGVSATPDIDALATAGTRQAAVML